MQTRRCNAKRLKMMSAVQNRTDGGLSLGQRSLQSGPYNFPLIAVRPDCIGVRKEMNYKLKPDAIAIHDKKNCN